MATLDDPPFLPGPMDMELARIRADQATAKFLPELLNSREFCERYEIRRRPSACARFTSGLFWVLAGAAVMLLAVLALPQLLLLLGGDVGRALSTRSSNGAPAAAWPAAAQQLSQQHLPNPHPYQNPSPHSSAGQHALGGGVAARVAGASVAVTRMLEAFGVQPGARPNNPHPESTAQQPAAPRGAGAPPADQMSWSEGAEADPPAPDAPTPPSSPPPPSPPSPPTGTAAAAPHSTDPTAKTDPVDDPDPVHSLAQERPAQTAHHRHTAPPVPKPAPPPLTPPPTSSPLSVTSLELRFACWQLQPPALRQQMEPAVPRTAVPNADVAAAAAAPVAPQPSPSAAPRIRAPRPLLAAFVVVSGLLVLTLAMLVTIAVSLAAPLADCLAVVLPAAGISDSPTEADPDESKTPSADASAIPPHSTDASTSTVTETSAVSAADPLAQPLPRSDSHSGLNPAARPQQLQAGGCSPVAHSPMESTAASGGTWSSRSGGVGEDGEDRAQPYTAAATCAGQSAARIKALAEEAGEQASDTTPATKWAKLETPSRAPSFRDQLLPLPEAFAVRSVAARVEPQSAALQPQTATPQLQASDRQTTPHRQELSTPSAGAATSGSAATSTSTGSRSRLPSVLRPLVAYGGTPVSQPPAAGGTGAACAAATPGAVSDGASPPLDATSTAAPWPFVYPDSVERARLTATPTASTTSTSGSEGVRAAAAAAAAAALTPAVWFGTAALAGPASVADDSDHPIFDLSHYDMNGDELPSPSPSTAWLPPRLSVLPRTAAEELAAVSGGASAAADGGAGRPPPQHRWRLAKKAVSLKLHAARRTATDTSAHRDSHNADSVSGGSGSGGSGGGLASGAAVNAALQAAADAADQIVETPRLAPATEQQLQLQRGPSLTLQLSEAVEMETPVWPPLYGRQARGAGAVAAAADPAEGEGGGACGDGEGGDDVESSGHFAAEALTLADCLSAARGSRGGCATPVAAAAASAAAVAAAAVGEMSPLGAWSSFGQPADLCNDRAVPAHSPSISSVLPAALHRAPELDREHVAAAAAAVATLQSLKHSARRLVEATRAGSYWRPQDGPESAGGADADQELRMAQTELHAAASQLKQLRLSAPSGSAPPAAAPARKALAFTPAATPFAAAAAAAAKMPRRPLADISAGAGSTPAGAPGWVDNRSSDSWASIGIRGLPHEAREIAAGDGDGSGAESASDSFLVTPAPRAPPVAPLPIRRSKIPLLTPASESAGAAATSPPVASMPQLHLGTAAVDVSTAATPGAAWVYAAGTPSASADSTGGLSSILAEVAAAAAAKAKQLGRKRLTDLVSPGDSASSGEGGRVRSGLPRLVPWPVLTATGSQQTRPPAPAPTPDSGTRAAPAIPFARSNLTSSVEQVQDLICGDDGGGSARSSSDGSSSAADSNKENCEPPAHESPRRRSSSSPASSSPASFHLAGHELPSDAEVQAFLAATALSQSPADAAAAASSPPLSPLESLLRVLPAAVEVLVVQLCALADLAAERQREVLAWHYQANACTVPLPFLADSGAAQAAPCTAAATAAAEQRSPISGDTFTAPSHDAAPVPADVTAVAAAAAAGGGLVATARCNSAEGRALALIGRLVDELLMVPSAEGLALELQAQAQQHEQAQQQLHAQDLFEVAEEPQVQEQPAEADDAREAQREEEEAEEVEGCSSSVGSVAEPSDGNRAVADKSEEEPRQQSAQLDSAVPEHPQQLAQPEPQAPADGYAGLTTAFLSYLEEEDAFSLWSPSNAAAALYHEWAAETPSAAAADRAAGPSPPSSIADLMLLLPVDEHTSKATPQSSSGSCDAGGAGMSGTATAAPPSPEPRRGDHDSGGGAYLRSVARARAAAGEEVEWQEGGQDDNDEEELGDWDAGSRVGAWAPGTFPHSNAPTPESTYPYLHGAAAAAAAATMAMPDFVSAAGSNGEDASPGDSAIGEQAATPVGPRLRVFAGMEANLPQVPGAPLADEELEAAAPPEDSGVTTEPPIDWAFAAADYADVMTPRDMSSEGSEAGGLLPFSYSAAALAAWSPMPDTPGSQRALWRPRLPGSADA
ncbi:hypothetical protein CHLRE_10g432350v5 [Chlamydomonas reinhardtii]|uniref:Uncharacterized protein n=1 Tax=Chlamydomonas reinhardtii TaxID=3055 RepID=A0A2K3D9Y2_CHLRE|nr:uncharacterized protein CHLRE_10g432350v5 [Chlamydomonas reinhardtii]PNW77340.1 hypothetical protein CHLRE_10g432350v5 [Chlamydomonas reinhardtii]